MNLLKILFKRKILLIMFLVFILFIFYLSFKNNLTLIAENSIIIPNQEKIFLTQNQKIQIKDIELNIINNPIHLKIPSINIDVIMEEVGLTSDGAMDVPKGPNEVAWFNLGPSPGEIGSAVIAGHSGWRNGIQAVFDNLYKLKIGDKIYVENDKGETITFVVRKIQKYNPNIYVSEVFNSSDGKSHLNLVTCTGLWNYINKTHSKRLVIFTDKE